jgi:uncharacterized membrane protein YdjX (TVP38/TMEM64 family)
VARFARNVCRVDAPPVTAKPRRLHRLWEALRRLGPAGPLAVANTVMPPLGALCLLGVLAMVAPDLQHSRSAPFLCAAGFALLGGVSLMPTYALSILAGWSWGFWTGFACALSGIVGASLVSYMIAQRVSAGRLMAMIDEKPSWRAVHFALLGGSFWRAIWIIALLRNAPVPPFGLTNFVLGAAHVKMSRFFLGTTLGMAPHAGAIVLVASGLHQLNFKAAESPWIIVSGVVATIAVIVTIERLARRALEKVAKDEREREAKIASAHP